MFHWNMRPVCLTRARGVLAALGTLAMVVVSLAAFAIDDISKAEASSCLQAMQGDFRASPSTVRFGDSTTLRWKLSGCPHARISITGAGAAHASGSRVVKPMASQTLRLTATYGGVSRSWDATISVSLPKDQWGRINVTITSNDQVETFIQAISSEESTDAVVYIQNHVSLDLSYRQNIHIYPGVQILGGRSAREPGPLLYTTTYPGRLFVIGQYLDIDNVRISGIRLRGADLSAAPESSPSSVGIHINSSVNIEIDNNEIYGWHVAAITVADTRNRIDRGNGVGAVRIHDNWIHHNQRIGEGYGVEVGEGAYALVDRNYFDFNRHAIAGDGEFGSGYFFYRNYVGTGGGQHEGLFGIDYKTHQIDMHGQEDCYGADGYCGIAGDYMDIRHNSIMYTAGLAILLRGSPTKRMDVTANAFAHTDEWGHFLWDRSAAMAQSDSVPGYGNLLHWNNLFGAALVRRASICDFNGDGVNDTFASAGASWLYTAGGAPNGFNGYRYLNRSTLGAAALTFGDFNNDGKCDVKVAADGRVSWSGTAPLDRLESTDILLRNAGSGQVKILQMQDGVIAGESYPTLPANRVVLGAGDFDGDGDADVLSKEVLAGSQRIMISLLEGGVLLSDFNAGYVEANTQFQGIADFDGDHGADVLWRLADGSLRMWLRAKAPADLVQAPATHRNWPAPSGAPGFDWQIKGLGDVNGDGYADIIWRRDDGQVAVWLMVGSIFTADFLSGGPDAGLTWKIAAIGDFDGDGVSDILWRYLDGQLAIWFKGLASAAAYPTWQNRPGWVTGLEWQIQGVSDFNADGRSDILWRRTDGVGSIWLMNGALWAGEPPLHLIDPSWQQLGLLAR